MLTSRHNPVTVSEVVNNTLFLTCHLRFLVQLFSVVKQVRANLYAGRGILLVHGRLNTPQNKLEIDTQVYHFAGLSKIFLKCHNPTTIAFSITLNEYLSVFLSNNAT